MGEVAVRKDLLARLLARRQITFPEYLAGREWQRYLEATHIQLGACYDWDVPLYDQRLYQPDGALSDIQCDAIDVRRIVENEIGSTSFGDLDRVLSLPETTTVRLSEAGVAYVSRLLQIVSVILDIQAGGSDFGSAQEEWERRGDPTAILRREQPWLFERPKQKAPMSTNRTRGKLAA